MATFTGLNISLSGLYSNQTSLYTTNSNISSASDEDYTVQTVSLSSSRSASIYQGMYATSAGAEVTDIERERNAYYDATYREQNASYQEWYYKSKYLTEIEGVFNELSDEGLTALLSDFYTALEDLTVDPTDSATRYTLIESVNALCESLNTTSDKLYTLQNDINDEVSMYVDEINTLSKQVSTLNKEIEQVELTGGNANSLYDQRDALIDDLSEICEVNVYDADTGSDCRITLDGYSLVDGDDYNTLECIADGTLYDGSSKWSIQWRENANSVTFENGKLQACLDLRDGTGIDGNYDGVPYYVEELNAFAQNLARTVNEGLDSEGNSLGAGHADGYSTDGDTSIRIFSFDSLSSVDFIASGADLETVYEYISAANITLSSDLVDNPDAIATTSIDGEEGGTDIIASIIDLLDSNTTNYGTLEESLSMIQTHLGIAGEFAIGKEETELSLLEQAESTRLSVSSVSINDESNKLIQYEKLYNANAQMISIWQEIYETIISKIGG